MGLSWDSIRRNQISGQQDRALALEDRDARFEREIKRAPAIAEDTKAQPERGVFRLFTWRNALLGPAIALSGLIMLTACFMVMRGEGIGPQGTLIASGELKRGGRVLVVDFTDRTGDPGLSAAVTEALRADLAQSPIVSVVNQAAVRDALARMGLDSSMPVDRSVALEIA